MKNWRTTIAGGFTAFFAFVVYSPEDFSQWPWLVHLAKFAAAGGFLAMGAFSKDFSTHSTEGEVKMATAEKTADALKAANQ